MIAPQCCVMLLISFLLCITFLFLICTFLSDTFLVIHLIFLCSVQLVPYGKGKNGWMKYCLVSGEIINLSAIQPQQIVLCHPMQKRPKQKLLSGISINELYEFILPYINIEIGNVEH